ncbi:MAG: hypothetical protein INH37_14125 [Myxococcaceae bacterium]|nr:hypothetical protein [Myxococcaceae bacterium]
MKRGWMGLVVIFALAGAVLAAKALREPAPAAPTASAPVAASAQVWLFADPAEADSSCGCGEVFRAVRAAAARGVALREVDPQKDQVAVREHKVTVTPTVLVLDGQGREIGRHEGESSEVLAALRADLEHLQGANR